MSKMKYGFTASALIVSLGLITAPGAFAKMHDSGVSTDESGPPAGGRSGTPPGDRTSGLAQGLGAAAQSSDKGFSGDARSGEPGFSAGKGDVSGGAGGTAGGPSSRGR